MKIIDFGVQEPYRSFILNGQKTVEGRLNKGKFQAIEVGDILKFETGEKFKVKRKGIYKSFFEMMETEGLSNVLPDKEDIQDGVETVYYKFYSKELEDKFGVAAIEIAKI